MPDLPLALQRVVSLERDAWSLTLNNQTIEQRSEQWSIGNFERTLSEFYASVARLEAEVAEIVRRK